MFSLAAGCTLLISGSIADVVGAKEVFVLGCLLQTIFCVACGLSRTGTQLIISRIFSGIATSLCLPTAVSLISENFPAGREKNLAFAAMGGGQPIGFGLGLTIGGIFVDTVGWDWGFHIIAIANGLLMLLGMWQLPAKSENAPKASLSRLVHGIDWMGAVTISVALATVSYVLAYVESSTLYRLLTYYEIEISPIRHPRSKIHLILHC